MARSARLERATPSSGVEEPCVASGEDKGPTYAHSGACTTACTTEADLMRQETLETLAAALRNLSPEDRAKLAELVGNPERDPQ